MYTVKKLQRGEEYRRIKISETKTLVSVAKNGGFAVVDEDGKVVFIKNKYTGKSVAEIFPRKSAARQEADYLNRVLDKS